MRILLLPSFLLLSLASLHLSAQTVARVGDVTIERTHIERRIAVERAYGGTMATEAALVALVNDATEREVARSIGELPDDAELRRFSAHADATSKAPEILAAVKSVFGSDTAAYIRLFLAPRVVNARLQSWFERTSVANRRTLVAIGPSFDAWFTARAAAIAVTIDDAALRIAINEAYPNVAWARDTTRTVTATH
jgi:hypothetical protein